MACGGKGVISVTANIMPAEVAAMVDAFEAGNMDAARRLHLKLLKISNAMFLESNPIPVKTALGLMGKCSDEMRLPLCPMADANKGKLVEIMKEYNLI
jgi:4-hydroxy-tetrahydrodipicolinate synthase